MRTMARKFLPTIGLSIGLTLFCSVCFSHSKLDSASPADKANLTELPAVITLTFRDTVKLATVSLDNTTGNDTLLSFSPSEPSTVYTITNPPLQEGTNILTWRALASDGHLLTGEVTYQLQLK